MNLFFLESASVDKIFVLHVLVEAMRLDVAVFFLLEIGGCVIGAAVTASFFLFVVDVDVTTDEIFALRLLVEAVGSDVSIFFLLDIGERVIEMGKTATLFLFVTGEHNAAMEMVAFVLFFFFTIDDTESFNFCWFGLKRKMK